MKKKRTSSSDSFSHHTRKITIKDCTIYGILLLFTVAVVILELIYNRREFKWYTLLSIVGDFALITLFVACLFDFLYDHNIRIAVPNAFIFYKEQKLKTVIKEVMYEVLDAQCVNLLKHDEEIIRRELVLIDRKTDYSLSSMRTVELRNRGLCSVEDARKKLEELVFQSGIVQDISKTPYASLTPQLRYYIRFPDLMSNEQNRELILNITSTFIAHSSNYESGILPLSEKANSFITSPLLDDIEVIVTPNNGNYLLGHDVSRKLCKDHIKVIHPSKIIDNNAYEGKISSDKEDPRVIIVHDVLATGKQIIESINSLRDAIPKVKIIGVFSLIYRTGGNAKELVQSKDVPVYTLLELSEDEITKKLENAQSDSHQITLR